LRRFRVRVNGKEYDVEIEEVSSQTQVQQTVSEAPETPVAARKTEPVKKVEEVKRSEPEVDERPSQSGDNGGTNVVSPMSGTILEVFVSVGDSVSVGQKLLILEAMKMENSILAESSGMVQQVKVRKGDNIDAGETMIVLGS
jgi:biotin carboxyl carrier protein